MRAIYKHRFIPISLCSWGFVGMEDMRAHEWHGGFGIHGKAFRHVFDVTICGSGYLEESCTILRCLSSIARITDWSRRKHVTSQAKTLFRADGVQMQVVVSLEESTRRVTTGCADKKQWTSTYIVSSIHVTSFWL